MYSHLVYIAADVPHALQAILSMSASCLILSCLVPAGPDHPLVPVPHIAPSDKIQVCSE